MNRKPLAVLIAIAVLVLAPRSHAQASDVAVVVSAANPITTLSLGDLRKMLSGEKRSWPGHIQIKLICRAPGTHERVVWLKLMNMSESEYKQYWTAQVFRGEADSAPVDIPSIGMLMEAIKIFPGALSFVDAREVKPGMKVVKIDGLQPGDPGYLIH